MIFLYPYFFSLFTLPLLVWILTAYAQKREVFSHEVRQRLSTSTPFARYTSRRYIWLFVFFLIVIALARPVWLKENKEDGQKIQMSFLAISLDISKSMLASDVTPNRLEFSKRAIGNLFQTMPDFKIALNAFSKDVFMVAPFSDDKETLTFLLENLSQDSMTSEGSSIEAVMMGAERIYAPFKREIKDILIVTDGADGLGIKEAIQKAHQNKLRVHLLLVGTKEGTTIKESNGQIIYDHKRHEVLTKRADELQELADATGGVYVATSGSLSDIGWLSEQIRLKAQKDESELMLKRYADELFYYPLGCAILVLFFIFNSLHVKHLRAIVPFLLLLLSPQTLHCDIFDFWSILKAEELYTNRHHKEALEYFIKIDTSKKSDITQYNLANSYYRNKEFAKAAQLYDEINTTNETVNYERLHNLGNALTQLGRKNDAIEAYEKALKIKEDQATRFNLKYIQDMEDKAAQSDDQEQKEKQKEDKPQEQQAGKQQNDQNETKEDDKEPQSKAPKPMDEQETKKWEKILKNTKPKTKPQALIKNEQMEKKSEIFW